MRVEKGVVPTMKRVDTCAAEFEAVTPYLYSSYDGDCECVPTTSKKVWPSPYPLVPRDPLLLKALLGSTAMRRMHASRCPR